MARQRMITTSFWSDPWIVDELNPLDRYLFLYLLTNEKTNVIGVYEMSLRTMSNETGIEKEELLRMLQRLESRVVYVDGWVVFRKATKHQNYKSPKIAAGIARELQNMPDNVLQYIKLPDHLCKTLNAEYGIDTVSIGYTSHIAPNLTKPNLTKPNLTKPNALFEKSKTRVEKVDPVLIDEALATWHAVVGFEIDGLGNRKACASLIRHVGPDKLEQLIRGVALSHEDQYAPRISDFVSLKRKMNDLVVWGKKKGMSSVAAKF